MGTTQSIRKINFEDLQWALQNPPNILISTMKDHYQNCLILGTTSIAEEENLINSYLQKDTNTPIIIYGTNSSDNSIVDKYAQLCKLGFTNVYIYPGGMFEWLLLQDVFGDENFLTTSQEIDILKYKGNQQLGVLMLKNE